MTLAGLHPPKAGHGFSLVELLLAIALLVLLVGATVFNFSSLQRGAQLEEGATRLESIFRFARAHAANTGRKVQLQFELEETDESTEPFGLVRVTWEPDPLGQPGYFETLTDTAWQIDGLNELVQVEEVHLLDPNGSKFSGEASMTDLGDEEAGEPWGEFYPPVTFYPDGSSDSAEIILLSREPEDDRRMSVKIIGITGVIRREVVRTESDEPDADTPEPPMEPNVAPKKEPSLPKEDEIFPEPATNSASIQRSALLAFYTKP